jgi:hypothetical protein
MYLVRACLLFTGEGLTMLFWPLAIWYAGKWTLMKLDGGRSAFAKRVHAAPFFTDCEK